MSLSLGTLTDLAIHRLSGARIVEHGTHVEVHRDDNPTFRWGNFIQVLDHESAPDVDLWVARYEAAFPGKDFWTFGLPDADCVPSWEAAGFDCDTEETLTASAPPLTTECPDGYVVRPIREWAGVVDYELSVHPDNGREFLEASHRAAQQLVERGVAEFIGAYTTTGELAAKLGIVVCPEVLGETGLARYQSVSTAPDHRRRGLASHLVGAAGAWAGERGATRFVICTETTNPAGRVYRRAGFEPSDASVGAEKVGVE